MTRVSAIVGKLCSIQPDPVLGGGGGGGSIIYWVDWFRPTPAPQQRTSVAEEGEMGDAENLQWQERAQGGQEQQRVSGTMSDRQHASEPISVPFLNTFQKLPGRLLLST